MSNFHGVDITRAYEVAWLNNVGKPEIAILEIFQDSTKPNTDSWKLKKFLLDINNKNFADYKALRSEIYNFLNKDSNFADSYIKLTTRQDFHPIDFTKFHTPEDFPHKTTHGLRFICANTEQQYIGAASIYTAAADLKAHELLIDFLSAMRNEKYTPQSFATELFKRFNILAAEFALSVNLNRRGGMSFQNIRSNKSPDFADYTFRSVLE